MDWTEVGLPLEVGETPEAMIAIGSWSLEGGTVWLDEVRIERGAGGNPASIPVGYDSRFVAPQTLSNPDFYLWYHVRRNELWKHLFAFDIVEEILKGKSQ